MSACAEALLAVVVALGRAERLPLDLHHAAETYFTHHARALGALCKSSSASCFSPHVRPGQDPAHSTLLARRLGMVDANGSTPASSASQHWKTGWFFGDLPSNSACRCNACVDFASTLLILPTLVPSPQQVCNFRHSFPNKHCNFGVHLDFPQICSYRPDPH